MDQKKWVLHDPRMIIYIIIFDDNPTPWGANIDKNAKCKNLFPTWKTFHMFKGTLCEGSKTSIS
jgi:hypothetical protein